ncbi:spore coat protein CotJB [Dethiothermospora halolimnae]|uniref:spore coat protein CotJB n=1 Tax=Dethiothermospora halolimnae TaxID=3114390 RepID=UPI003CCBAC06
MDSKQLRLLEDLMAIEFCLVETNLYLDTHPTDERALRLHNSFVKKHDELKCMYENKYGPLTHQSMSRCPWEYIKGPWPWEIDYCGCD